MTQEDKEREEYLLSIGVTNLDDDKEIDEKLDQVEREHPENESMILEALEEISNDTETPTELLTTEDIINWLLSLGD